MRPFIGNPCGYGNCLNNQCDKCKYWSPCIYYGKKYKQIKLPKWPWLINFLYKLEHWLICRNINKKGRF